MVWRLDRAWNSAGASASAAGSRPRHLGKGGRLDADSGDVVKYRAPFKGAFRGLIQGRFRADSRYLDVWGRGGGRVSGIPEGWEAQGVGAPYWIPYCNPYSPLTWDPYLVRLSEVLACGVYFETQGS